MKRHTAVSPCRNLYPSYVAPSSLWAPTTWAPPEEPLPPERRPVPHRLCG